MAIRSNKAFLTLAVIVLYSSETSIMLLTSVLVLPVFESCHVFFFIFSSPEGGKLLLPPAPVT